MQSCNYFHSWQVGGIVMGKVKKLAEEKECTIQDAIRMILYRYVNYPGEPVKPEYHAIDKRWSNRRGYIFVSVDDDYVRDCIYPICEYDNTWVHPMDMMNIHLIKGALQQC